jgi:hypothetical protein
MMVVGKLYSVIWAFRKMQMTGFIIVLIVRDDDDDGSLRFCVLNESYSLAFNNDDDLSEINSGSVQYKIKFKTENCGPMCHSLELQRQ